MFNKIEDFLFEKCFQTRPEATTELIRPELESIKKEQAEAKKMNTQQDSSTQTV